MPIRTADAEWHGTLREGRGVMRLGTQATSGEFTWNSRFSDGGGTNPEEMVGAAHAGCFSMALAGDLGECRVQAGTGVAPAPTFTSRNWRAAGRSP